MHRCNLIFLMIAVLCCTPATLLAEFSRSLDPRYPTGYYGYNITTDHSTGLDWLLTSSGPYVPLSEFEALLLTPKYSEWQWATNDQIWQYFKNLDLPVGVPPEYGGTDYTDDGDAYEAARFYIGVSGTIGNSATTDASGKHHLVQAGAWVWDNGFYEVYTRFGPTSIPAETKSLYFLVRPTPVPEPSTFALAGIGGLAMFACVIRRRLSTRS